MDPVKFTCHGDSVMSSTCNKKRKEVLVSQGFDEQLQFINVNGVFLRNLKYTLDLANGTTLVGTTDSAGRTERIRTNVPVAIVKAKLQPEPAAKPNRAPTAPLAHTCSIHAPEMPDFIVLEINGIKTNHVEVGASVAQVETAADAARPLTAGEITMARVVFKDAINYEKVKIHNGEFLWLGAQNDETALAPNGEIYFNTDAFKEDFSASDGGDRLWFMHEMTHVWQFQLGYPVLKRALRYLGVDLPRKYNLDEDDLLSEFNMEAQGNIIADYWAILDAKERGTTVKYMHRPQYMHQISVFEKVLREFLANPKDTDNLPNFFH